MFRVRQGPVQPQASWNLRAAVSAAHRYHRVVRARRHFRQRLAAMGRKVVAQLGHRLHRPGIDLPAGTRAGAITLYQWAAQHAGERLGHLAAVGVFHTDEKQPHGPRPLCGLGVSRFGHGHGRLCYSNGSRRAARFWNGSLCTMASTTAEKRSPWAFTFLQISSTAQRS